MNEIEKIVNEAEVSSTDLEPVMSVVLREIKIPRMEKPKGSYDFARQVIKFGYWEQRGAVTTKPLGDEAIVALRSERFDKMIFVDDDSSTEWGFVPDDTQVDVVNLLGAADNKEEEEVIQELSVIVSRICLELKKRMGEDYSLDVAHYVFEKVAKKMNVLS